MTLDRVFPLDQCDDEVGAAYQRGDTRWWTVGPQHQHRQGAVPNVWAWPVMDDEGEVA